jgi:hypothetical protein
MNEKQAAKAAAKFSKEDGEAQFVVWVFDDGRHVYSAEQTRRYAPFLHIEAAYVAGVKVADAHAVLEAA